MASELSLLIPEFRKKVIDVLAACAASGNRMESISTIVTPLEQASHWKQGRSVTDAELKTLAIEKAGAPYLAECMRNAKAHETNIVTDTLPGFSWHQWGEAVTCVWIDSRSGKLCWNLKTAGYQTLATQAEKAGLFITGSELRLREKFPADLFTIQEIDAEMSRRYAK